MEDFYANKRKQYLQDCEDIEYYCMFIGYGRSGHSLIGSLLGDKKGGRSSRQLQYNFGLLSDLNELVKVPQKFIHVYRNPFDNITTMSLREKKPLATAMDEYFTCADVALKAKARIAPENWIDIKQELFIENPSRLLSELCRFLGQEASKEYLSDCASIVFRSPRKSRSKIDWPGELVEMIVQKMKKYEFLAGYSYEGE